MLLVLLLVVIVGTTNVKQAAHNRTDINFSLILPTDFLFLVYPLKWTNEEFFEGTSTHSNQLFREQNSQMDRSNSWIRNHKSNWKRVSSGIEVDRNLTLKMSGNLIPIEFWSERVNKIFNAYWEGKFFQLDMDSLTISYFLIIFLNLMSVSFPLSKPMFIFYRFLEFS